MEKSIYVIYYKKGIINKSTGKNELFKVFSFNKPIFNFFI